VALKLTQPLSAGGINVMEEGNPVLMQEGHLFWRGGGVSPCWEPPPSTLLSMEGRRGKEGKLYLWPLYRLRISIN